MLVLAAILTLSSTGPTSKLQQVPPATATAYSTSTIRILPFGDSITLGWGSSHLKGYRRHLKDSSNELSFESVCIGSQKSRDMMNNEHEGFKSLIINHILMRIQRDEVFSSQPDVVLLHAGTDVMAHDACRQYWKGAIGRLEVWVDEMLHSAPNATVIVAQITQASLDGLQEQINVFNSAIPGLAAARAEAGAKVMSVNMSSIGADGSHLYDGAHPDDWRICSNGGCLLARTRECYQEGRD